MSWAKIFKTIWTGVKGGSNATVNGGVKMATSMKNIGIGGALALDAAANVGWDMVFNDKSFGTALGSHVVNRVNTAKEVITGAKDQWKKENGTSAGEQSASQANAPASSSQQSSYPTSPSPSDPMMAIPGVSAMPQAQEGGLLSGLGSMLGGIFSGGGSIGNFLSNLVSGKAGGTSYGLLAAAAYFGFFRQGLFSKIIALALAALAFVLQKPTQQQDQALSQGYQQQQQAPTQFASADIQSEDMDKRMTIRL